MDPETLELLAALGGGGLPAPPAELIGGIGPAPSSVGGVGSAQHHEKFAPPAPNLYYEGDDVALLQGMTTEQLGRLQDDLVAYGLVREVVPGRLDNATISGLGTLMALGNRQGVAWQDVLTDLKASGGTGAGGFEEQPRLAPDFASLAQKVKQTFQSELGRDPDAYEMQQLVAELDGFDRMSHEAEQDLARIDFDGGTEEVRAVDPLSRFQQVFEQKYANELDFVQDKKDAVVQRGAVDSMTGLVSQASRSSL